MIPRPWFQLAIMGHDFMGLWNVQILILVEMSTFAPFMEYLILTEETSLLIESSDHSKPQIEGSVLLLYVPAGFSQNKVVTRISLRMATELTPEESRTPTYMPPTRDEG